MKKANVLTLIFVLLIMPVLSLSSCDNERYYRSVVGEVAYVKTFEHHCVYIRPLDQGQDGIWIPVKVSEKTDSVSEYNDNAANMPELAIGSIVEVVYSVKTPRGSNMLSEYEAISIKSFDNSRTIENQDLPFTPAKNYEYSWDAPNGTRDIGTVVHVAKINAPLCGYILYVDGGAGTYQNVRAYWLDEGALERDGGISITSPELLSMIKSGQTGYDVAIFGLESYPFDSFNMQSVLGVSFYDPDIHW